MLRQQVFDLISAGEPLTVTVTGMDSGCEGERQFQSLCELLCEATEEASAAARDLGMVLDAYCLDPLRAWQVRCDILGRGPLYLRLAHQPLQRESWLQLWKLRSNSLISVSGIRIP